MGRPKKKTLLDEDVGNENQDFTLTVNSEFAKRFEHNKKREDLHRLNELQKAGVFSHIRDSSDESSSEEEDEDGLLPKAVDTKIFETLAKIKSKDPSIYVPEKHFFDENAEEGDDSPRVKKQKQSKKIYLKDVTAIGLEEDESEALTNKQNAKTYIDEQEDIRRAFLKAADEADKQDDDSGGLLKVRTKPSSANVDAKEGNAEGDREAAVVDKLEEYFGKDDELDENDRFLKEYLAREGWVDKDKGAVPLYQEIVGGVDEDEEELEKQEEFEASYNFRFEEGGPTQVEAYSRNVEGSVRKKSETRKEQRKAKQERNDAIVAVKLEELKRLKNLKKQELAEKLRQVQQVAGVEGALGLEKEDLDEDFDPDEYDRKMHEVFGKEYYEAEDELKNPEFDSEDELLGLPKGWSAGEDSLGFQQARKAAVEESSGSEDFENKGEDEATREEVDKKKRKKKLSLKEKMALEKSLEEYYKLDYEDLIGDLPTRFKYREVKRNSYGLSTKDIMEIDDKELNQVVSVKKLAPYRTDEWEVRGEQKKLMQKVVQKEKSKDKFRSDKKKSFVRKFREESTNSEGNENGADKEKVFEISPEVTDMAVESRDNSTKKEKHVQKNHPELKSEQQIPILWNSELEGLPKSAKKNLKRKLKKMVSKGGAANVLPASRLQSYGEDALPRKKQAKKLRKPKDFVS